MRRLTVLVAPAFCLLAPAGTPLAPIGLADAQTDAEWREYDPDDDLGIDAEDGLSDEELEAVVERAMVRVEEVREIEFEERPAVTVASREEFQEEYTGTGGDLPEDRATFANARLQALFLVGDDEDATDVRGENLNTSIAGFYTPATEEIVLVSDSDEPRLDERILAHELFHAYQDERWGLENYDDRTRDGSGGELGLIEGDAVSVETRYEERCRTDWECVIPEDSMGTETGEAGQPVNIGLLVLDFLPYDAGPAFVEAVHAEGGWDAVDALYDEPPASTEQVTSPESYPDDEPREVRIEDTNSGDWERVEPEGGLDYDRLGMGAITTMFVDPLYDSGGGEWGIPADEWFTYEGDPPAYGMFDYESRYASGWDGDRLHVYENGEDLGYVWTLAWDSPEDAATFAGGFDELLAYRGADRVESDTYVIAEGGYDGAYHVSVEGDTVTLTHAPATDALTAVSESAEPGSDDGVPEGSAGGDEPAEPAAGEDQPGSGIVAALVAVAASIALLVRRR